MQNSLQPKMIGFSQKDENLPQFFDEFNSKEKLRQLFLNLTNSLVDDIYHFTKYEQCHASKYTMEEIFKDKIKSMMPINYVKPFIFSKHFKLDVASTKVINNYQYKLNELHLYSNKRLLPVARLISLCFVNNKLQLNFDLDLLFHQFVLRKIKNLHKHKKVLDNGDSISIFDDNEIPLKIYTQWKSIDTKKLNIKTELDNAIECVKQSEFKQVYLVYPKHYEFKRHIAIEVEELEHSPYNIKVIPYSLRSIIK